MHFDFLCESTHGSLTCYWPAWRHCLLFGHAKLPRTLSKLVNSRLGTACILYIGLFWKTIIRLIQGSGGSRGKQGHFTSLFIYHIISRMTIFWGRREYRIIASELSLTTIFFIMMISPDHTCKHSWGEHCASFLLFKENSVWLSVYTIEYYKDKELTGFILHLESVLFIFHCKLLN